MTDREIFKNNLNYYLYIQEKKQKDLADYVGAKTTTVSGWTRGISYPRADAMEKIAMFFGIKTSQLITEDTQEEPTPIKKKEETIIHTPEARILAKGIDTMPQQQREALVTMMMGLYPNVFKKGPEDDDT